ncbi:hypothetical protein SanaruYs_32560 [Chryseotalea sanaruensis]|uniref:Uncharacterized protein n=1 Tax=Chryseotalea sanaruensis TaxID=2482724 RepID=A0A401UDN5_9BACT|nr:hypothetical protein [Chryseotalea sanaruensis]GCC53015.1 hypothetical protein SanaruYs_32560 [Chryseotalea sanaruensis]
MKLTFLRFNTNNNVKKNKTHRESVTFAKAQSVGILFSVEDRAKHDVVKELIKKLEGEGKKVTVLAFLPEKKENFEFLFNYFTAKDISFWGNLQSNDALSFSNTPFDFLYCLDESPNLMLQNILARCKAKCRIGKYADGNEAFFELMIESKNGVRSLAEGALKYSRELR